MMSPSVSIIVPCFNSAAYVGDALESALAQSSPALEVIAVDDGSQDDSSKVIRAFGSRVTLISQRNSGVSAARNAALDRSRGEYVLFLDADDLLDPEAVRTLTAATHPARPGVVLMGYRDFGPDVDAGRPPQLFDFPDFFPAIIRGNFGPNHTRLIPRAAAIAAGGFPVGMKIYEDWHFWTRVALLGTPLVSLPYVGALYRRHPASCLAAPREADVAAGYLALATLQCARIPEERPDVLAAHGDLLFWSGWTAYRRATAAGIGARETAALAHALEQIARRRPAGLKRSVFATLTRIAGFRIADHLRTATTARTAAPPHVAS